MDGFEWNPAKAAANLAKHKVDFADAALSLEDPHALTIADPDAIGEERFVTWPQIRQVESLLRFTSCDHQRCPGGDPEEHRHLDVTVSSIALGGTNATITA